VRDGNAGRRYNCWVGAANWLGSFAERTLLRTTTRSLFRFDFGRTKPKCSIFSITGKLRRPITSALMIPRCLRLLHSTLERRETSLPTSKHRRPQNPHASDKTQRCGVCRWQGSGAGETIGQQGIDPPREPDRRCGIEGPDDPADCARAVISL